MSHIQGVEYFRGETPSLGEIRNKLLQFKGGEITCIKDADSGIANICISHPERKNAISGKMMVDLEKIVDDLETWHDGKAILLHGANDIFCAGGDLNFVRQAHNPQMGYEMAALMSRTLSKLSNLPLISTAYISGQGALGGGAEITVHCDFRLMDSNPQTKIGFVHNRMGIIPAWGGTSRLVQILGRRKALNLLLSGSLLNGSQAIEIGLVDKVVNKYEEAAEWILNKVKCDLSVVRALKASVVNACRLTDDIEETERRIFAPLWGGSANRKAVELNIKHK